MLGTKVTFLLCPAGDCAITWLTISPAVFLVDWFTLNFCKFSILISNGINVKNAFLAQTKGRGEGKGKEEEGKGEREREIGMFLYYLPKSHFCHTNFTSPPHRPPPPHKKFKLRLRLPIIFSECSFLSQLTRSIWWNANQYLMEEYFFKDREVCTEISWFERVWK